MMVWLQCKKNKSRAVSEWCHFHGSKRKPLSFVLYISPLLSRCHNSLGSWRHHQQSRHTEGYKFLLFSVKRRGGNPRALWVFSRFILHLTSRQAGAIWADLFDPTTDSNRAGLQKDYDPFTSDKNVLQKQIFFFFCGESDFRIWNRLLSSWFVGRCIYNLHASEALNILKDN